jgi:hypothetical protein
MESLGRYIFLDLKNYARTPLCARIVFKCFAAVLKNTKVLLAPIDYPFISKNLSESQKPTSEAILKATIIEHPKTTFRKPPMNICYNFSGVP